jgi:hypothetical protein
MFIYTNVASGQVIESEHPLPRLDGLARWRRHEDYSLTRKSQTNDNDDAPAPARRPRNRKASK